MSAAAPTPPIHGEFVTYPFGDTVGKAYYARPAGDGPFPGVVVIHEIFGLNENMQDISRRFAREGYAALAVDLFAGRNRALCMFRFMSYQLLSPLQNGVQRELQAALSYLGARPEVNADRLGAAGFCLGGSFVIAWACRDSRLKAIAPFYGANPRPLEAVSRACPVVGSYPGQDFTAAQGRKLDAALTRHDIPHDIKIYPGARHAFFNDQLSAYDPAAAADSWERVVAFFGERLATPHPSSP